MNAHVNDDETVLDDSYPDVNLQHNLDVDITAAEITNYIKNLYCGKASGPDFVFCCFGRRYSYKAKCEFLIFEFSSDPNLALN